MSKFNYRFFLSLALTFSVFQNCFAYEAFEDIDIYRNKALNDTVSKILNYTEGFDESGSDQTFWYPFNAKECIYRKGSVVETVVINNTDSLDNPAPTNSPVKVLAFEPNVREIRLNTWTPSTVKVGYVQNAGTWWGPNNYYLQIMANGIPMLVSNKPRDLERTQAAWNLIFNRLCPGRKNNF